MSKNTQKPAKPYRDFPLTAHRNGQWCKKIRGKIWYFGRWNEPDAALAEYLRIRDDLQAGQQPRRLSDGPDLAGVCNAFLTRAKGRSDGGEISPRTFRDYHDVCRLMIRQFGPDFKGASKRSVRQQRAEVGEKLFQPSDIRTLLDAADEILRTMILLAANGGLGNSDIANLPQSAVNTTTGWIDFPRPKTGVERRFPLWPETNDAIKTAIFRRPTPSSNDLSDRVFLTHWGNSWVPEGRSDNQLSAKFRRLLRSTGLYRKGCGFYWLRHTFQTIGDEAGDPLATSHVMGHADGSIGGVYRERISNERLRGVVNHVRDWLLAEAKSCG